MSLTGSNEPPPSGAIFFQRDGKVRLHMSSDLDEEEEKSIMLASDFFQYSLQRKDWLAEFLNEQYSTSPSYLVKPRERKFSKLDLRVIDGGLSSGSAYVN